MFKKRCPYCENFKHDFHEKEYLDAFNLMKELVEKGVMTFAAGSCPLDELNKHIEQEEMYIIEHYFKCQCGLYFYTGFCVRGRPVLKIMKSLPEKAKKEG